jgi:carbonic anhydrase
VLRCCIDFRFWPEILRYVEERHLTRGDYDLDPNAGGIKDILDPTAQEHGIKGILISCRLHNTSKIVLVAHEDCGAYGGSQTFANKDEEKTFHIAQLQEACSILRKAISEERGTNDDTEFVLLWAAFSDDNTSVTVTEIEA